MQRRLLDTDLIDGKLSLSPSLISCSLPRELLDGSPEQLLELLVAYVVTHRVSFSRSLLKHTA